MLYQIGPHGFLRMALDTPSASGHLPGNKDQACLSFTDSRYLAGLDHHEQLEPPDRSHSDSRRTRRCLRKCRQHSSYSVQRHDRCDHHFYSVLRRNEGFYQLGRWERIGQDPKICRTSSLVSGFHYLHRSQHLCSCLWGSLQAHIR